AVIRERRGLGDLVVVETLEQALENLPRLRLQAGHPCRLPAPDGGPALRDVGREGRGFRKRGAAEGAGARRGVDADEQFNAVATPEQIEGLVIEAGAGGEVGAERSDAPFALGHKLGALIEASAPERGEAGSELEIFEAPEGLILEGSGVLERPRAVNETGRGGLVHAVLEDAESDELHTE